MPTLTLYQSPGTMTLSGTLLVGQVETLAVVIAASEAATFQSGNDNDLTLYGTAWAVFPEQISQ